MARDKRPAVSPSTPRTQKKAQASTSAGPSRSAARGGSSTSTGPPPPPPPSATLRAEFRTRDFHFELTIDPMLIRDHEGVPFARNYITAMGLEPIYSPPTTFCADLVRMFYQNISFPEQADVRPFAVRSMIGRTPVTFTPDEMAEALGFPTAPPDESIVRAPLDKSPLELIPHFGELGKGHCHFRRNSPRELWVLDTYLFKNLFPLGQTQERRGLFQQVLYAALQGQWFHFGEMLAHEMHHAHVNIYSGETKGPNVKLPFPRFLSFLLRRKIETIEARYTFTTCELQFTIRMWTNSLRRLMGRGAPAEEDGAPAEEDGAPAEEDVPAEEDAPVPPPADAAPPAHVPVPAFLLRAHYEYMDSLAHQLLTNQFLQMELAGIRPPGDSPEAALARAQMRSAGGGLLVPPPQLDEVDDGRSFRGIGIRGGPAPSPSAASAPMGDDPTDYPLYFADMDPPAF